MALAFPILFRYYFFWKDKYIFFVGASVWVGLTATANLSIYSVGIKEELRFILDAVQPFPCLRGIRS